jgi:hypothetical protein
MFYGMYMNALNNKLNLTKRYKWQHGLLILNYKKKSLCFSWVKG